jgi:hypothetical protein
VEPFTESGTLDPPLNQRVEYEVVLLEQGNGATALDFRLHDFYWPDSQNLVLKDVPVPA